MPGILVNFLQIHSKLSTYSDFLLGSLQDLECRYNVAPESWKKVVISRLAQLNAVWAVSLKLKLHVDLNDKIYNIPYKSEAMR